MIKANQNSISQRQFALIAGISLLVMTVAALETAGLVQGKLFVSEDPTATMNNIAQHSGLFRLGLFGWFVILLADIIVAWALYGLFKGTDKALSLLSGWLRLSYAAILAIAIACLMIVMAMIDKGVSNAGIIGSLLSSFDLIWTFALILFGVHLLVLGILALRSDMHNFYGIILIIAAVSYMLVHSAYLLFPQYDKVIDVVNNILSIPMMAEVVLAFYLVIKGGKMPVEAS